MDTRILIGLASIVTILAGCAQPEATPLASPTPTAPAGPDVGSLVVIVTTSELQPVEAAAVELAGTAAYGLTDAAGSFAFDGLEPTAYTVIVAKPGHKALQPSGRLVNVVAGETAEVKLVLDPIGVVSANNSYHRTFIFRGFISCSMERITVSPVGNRTQCGNGVDVAGTRVGRDPNDNFSHPWQVENLNLESIVLEAKWAPSFSALGDQLFIAAMDAFSCSAQSCNYANQVGGRGGKSPLHQAIQDDPGDVISKAFERHGGATYPKPAWSVARTYCGTGCTAALTLQQSYELLTSPFYGAPAPEGWSAYAG